MASITVRNLEDGLKRRLRIRAAENGRSMEQEARDILRAALDQEVLDGKKLGQLHPRPFRASRRRRTGTVSPRAYTGAAAA